MTWRETLKPLPLFQGGHGRAGGEALQGDDDAHSGEEGGRCGRRRRHRWRQRPRQRRRIAAAAAVHVSFTAAAAVAAAVRQGRHLPRPGHLRGRGPARHQRGSGEEISSQKSD